MIPDISQFTIFLLATLTVNLTPGPDMLYVIARSIGQGRRAGIVSSLGIGAGCLVHTLAAALGLSAVLLSSATAFNVIKYCGALYLVFLGLRILLQKEYSITEKIDEAGLGAIFRQGVITNVFNPKVAMFFLAFLPQFVDSSKGAVAGQMLFLGIIFVVSGTFWNTLVALLAGNAGRALKDRVGFWRFQRWLSGSVFIGLGARLALSK